MSHKIFHRIRWCCMAIIVAVIICANIMALRNTPESAGASILLFIIPVAVIIFIALAGRLICGFLCPLGLFQDILWKISEVIHLPKLNRKEKLMKLMNLFAKIFLGFFLCGMTAILLIFIFKPHMMKGGKFPVFVPFVAGPFMLFLNIIARRFFCNVCPIGSFIGLFEKLNLFKLKKDVSSCSMCGACYEACPMRIKSIYTETEKKDVTTSMCIFCGECIKKCPEDDALSMTLAGKKIYSSSRSDFEDIQVGNPSKKQGAGK